MSISHHYIGCDVSKSWLDVFDPRTGRVQHLDNTSEAISKFVSSLQGQNAFVLFEATGTYDSVLRTSLHTAGIASARLNPTMVRRYAQARGRKAKTDALDAIILADMGERLRPDPDPAPCPHRARLAALAARRDQLVAMRACEKTRLCEVTDPFLRLDLEEAICHLSQAIARIETEIEHHIQENAILKEQARLLASAPGVGPVTAQVLLALMPELGNTNPKRLAALAGLAPFNHDSGKLKGIRCISGGRARVRRALFMAAMRAARISPKLKAFADRITDASKVRKIAIIATARKLLTILNAMLRENATYKLQ